MNKPKIIIPNKAILLKVIKEEIALNGYEADLNHLDVSQVTNMASLFSESKFNGDISRWDTSNVRDMMCMFLRSKFNGDISQWNVSNVKNMRAMFAQSAFTGDINDWDVSNVTNMTFMLRGSKIDFNQYNLNNWTPYKASIIHMFDKETNVVPYWYNYQYIEERKIHIERYIMNVELEKQLVDKKNLQIRKKL